MAVLGWTSTTRVKTRLVHGLKMCTGVADASRGEESADGERERPGATLRGTQQCNNIVYALLKKNK